jgi:hypothetical protein
MTQNTQTTTERITALIFDAIRMDSTTFETVDAECATIAAEIDGLRDELAVILRERNDAHLALAEARAEVERLRPAAEAWRQVFELQAKYSTHWRLNDETYWLARFMEEVGELAGALVGNHVGPVEWELSQLAAIALNWLDMRAARAQAAKEAKP